MKQIVLKIGGMTCSACSNSLEHFLKKQDKIKDATVNLVLASASITYDDDLTLKDLEKIVNRSGFTSLGEFKMTDESNKKDFVLLMIFLGLTIFFMYVTMGHMVKLPTIPWLSKHHPKIFGIFCLSITIPYLIYGFDIIQAGIKNIFYKSPNMDTLVTLGVLSSFIYSLANLILIFTGRIDSVDKLFFESATMVIFFVKLGRFLDQRIKNKTKSSIKELVQITPLTAKKKAADGFEEVTIDLVNIDDLLIASAGDKIAVDGEVTSGECYVDEAFITGESKPVKKAKGDIVIAGSVLYNGYVEYLAKKIGKDSAISEIVKMVVEATNSKAKIAKLADHVSGIFVPSIIGIAVCAFIFYIIITRDLSLSINTFVTVLVVACPCALGLATPLAIVTSVGTLAKLNILIKNGEVLEQCAKVDTVIFDKTGTLTYGKLKIAEKIIYIDDLEQIVGALETKSNHPIATAFPKVNLEITEFETLAGMGIKGKIGDDLYYLGNNKLIEHLNIINNHLNDEKHLKMQGNTIIYVVKNNEIHALYGIKDVLRDNVKDLIKELKQRNIKTVMLTGDSKEVAQIIAEEIAIDETISDAMPIDKLAYIKKTQQEGHIVLMIGDGINDAPSLVEANVGLSIKNATSVASDSADAIIMNDNIGKIVDLITISKRTILNIKENLFWAFFYNILMIPIACGALAKVGIHFTPMIASIGMTLSSLCVLLNALRLIKYKKK